MAGGKRNFWYLVAKFNKEKGYGQSMRRAMLTALKEEKKPIPSSNQHLFSFLVYVLTKAYFRYYRWFTREIAFKRGFTKFMLYSLDMFIPANAKAAYEEVKEEMMKLG